LSTIFPRLIQPDRRRRIGRRNIAGEKIFKNHDENDLEDSLKLKCFKESFRTQC
jgi:hypothetical protein